MAEDERDSSPAANLFLLGLAAGAGLALLLAPRAGREIRRTIKGKAGELRELLIRKHGLFEELLEAGEEVVRARIRKELRKLDEKLADYRPVDEDLEDERRRP